MKLPHLLLLLLLAAPSALTGQALRDDPRLQPAMREGLERVVRAAERDHLPAEPLLLKALEGVSKGAPAVRVVAVVEGMAGRMRVVRGELGEGASADALVAGAAALHAGAKPTQLGDLARSTSAAGAAAAFGALAYLLEKGISPLDSVEMLRTLAATGGRPADFLSLQRLTELDVRGGATPAEAAWRRTRELARLLPAPPR